MGTSSNAVNLMFEQVHALFRSGLQRILEQERHNENRINLYSVGEYWAAFEQSAYQLQRMTRNEAPPVILYLEQHPFPIVMHNVHRQQMAALCRDHVPAKKTPQHLQLLTQPLDAPSYHRWYKEHVED